MGTPAVEGKGRTRSPRKIGSGGGGRELSATSSDGAALLLRIVTGAQKHEQDEKKHEQDEKKHE